MKEYWELTDIEIMELRQKGIINGFGPRNSPILHTILKWLTPTMDEASADIHDYNYYKGGAESDRSRADEGFLKYMLIDCQKLDGIRRVYYVLLAYLYYNAVRLFGWKYFNYN